MRTSLAIALAALMGAIAACDVEEQEPEPAPATEAERIEGRPQAAAPDQPADQPTLTIRVDSLPGAGPYITDGDGRALYVLEGEPEGESTCYDQCAREWPPVLVSRGQPAPGAAPVRADQLGTIERRDGQRQATFDGHALYYYHDDEGPGDTAGHHLTDQWGEWYLIRPDGELLEGHGG